MPMRVFDFNFHEVGGETLADEAIGARYGACAADEYIAAGRHAAVGDLLLETLRGLHHGKNRS